MANEESILKLKEEKENLLKQISNIDEQIEQEAKKNLAEISDLQERIVSLANEFNTICERDGLDMSIGIILGDGTRSDRGDSSWDSNNNARYLVRKDGKNFWFPSTLDC